MLAGHDIGFFHLFLYVFFFIYFCVFFLLFVRMFSHGLIKLLLVTSPHNSLHNLINLIQVVLLDNLYIRSDTVL